jgi:hypothetical protein
MMATPARNIAPKTAIMSTIACGSWCWCVGKSVSFPWFQNTSKHLEISLRSYNINTRQHYVRDCSYTYQVSTWWADNAPSYHRNSVVYSTFSHLIQCQSSLNLKLSIYYSRFHFNLDLIPFFNLFFTCLLLSQF